MDWQNKGIGAVMCVAMCFVMAGCRAVIPSYDAGEAIQGTWKSDQSVAVYEVLKVDGTMSVRGYSSYSGKELQIGEVSWDGVVLRFTSYMPSTDFKVVHENRLIDPRTMSSRTVGKESHTVIWQKVPAP